MDVYGHHYQEVPHKKGWHLKFAYLGLKCLTKKQDQFMMHFTKFKSVLTFLQLAKFNSKLSCVRSDSTFNRRMTYFEVIVHNYMNFSNFKGKASEPFSHALSPQPHTWLTLLPPPQ